MTSFGHSKPCQKTMHIYASLSLIISLIKLMSVNYAYNNKKKLTWIFMKGTGCYILPNLQKFRPRNLRHTWTEEYSGTSSHQTSSCHTGGPLSFDVPRAPMSTKWPCPSGLASVDPGIGLKLCRDTLLITCPNGSDTNYTISLWSCSHVSLFELHP